MPAAPQQILVTATSRFTAPKTELAAPSQAQLATTYIQPHPVAAPSPFPSQDLIYS